MPKPVSGLHHHSGYWLRRLSDLIHTSFARKLAESDVTVAEWCVLICLYRGEAESPSEIADFIGVDRGSVTRTVDKLVARELIERTTHDDRRRTPLMLTEKARKIVPALSALADRNDREYFSVLNKSESRTLEKILAKLLANAGVEMRPR